MGWLYKFWLWLNLRKFLLRLNLRFFRASRRDVNIFNLCSRGNQFTLTWAIRFQQ